jgi:hypothetical protein
MSPSKQQLRTPIPDRHHNLVSLPQPLQRVSPNTGQTEVADLDYSRRGDKDVGRLEISMDDVVRVEVEDAVEKLMKEGFEGWERDRRAKGGGMVVDYLLGWQVRSRKVCSEDEWEVRQKDQES